MDVEFKFKFVEELNALVLRQAMWPARKPVVIFVTDF